MFVQLDFSAFAMLFMKSIYQFTTFKVIPDDVMKKIIKYFQGSTTESKGRKLEELPNPKQIGLKKTSTYFENLNIILFGVVSILILILFIMIARGLRCFSLERRKKIKKVTTYIKIRVYHGIH